MRTKIVIPTYPEPDPISKDELRRIVDVDTALDFACIDKGPTIIESSYDVAVVVPFILKEVVRGEKEGYDAVIVFCFEDAGLYSARELVDIPVVGPGETSMLFASMLGPKFSVITLSDRVRPLIEKNARQLGLDEKLASIESVKSHLESPTNSRKHVKVFVEKAKEAIDKGGEVIILGSTSLSDLAQRMQKELDVPVVDPATASIKMAEIQHSLGLSHSKLAYPKPAISEYSRKRIKQFEDLRILDILRY